MYIYIYVGLGFRCMYVYTRYAGLFYGCSSRCLETIMRHNIFSFFVFFHSLALSAMLFWRAGCRQVCGAVFWSPLYPALCI